MKRTFIIASVLTAVAIGAMVFMTRRADAKAGDYRFVQITKSNIESTVSATGTLNAVSTVQVGTQVSGQVAEIRADFNDRVRKGELIARIDPTLAQQAVEDAKATLDRAQADLDQKNFLLDQAKPLFANRVITESEYRTAEYNVAVARASLKSAQSQLERAQRNVDYTYIRAPVDGTVIERNVDVGQTVAASLSAPQLFLIAEDLSRMQILVSVDESDIGSIHDGQAVRFGVQAWPDREFTGIVRQVRLQSKATDNVVSYTVVVEVENRDGILLPGMTATVDFIIAQATDVLAIPNAALRFRPTESMLAQLPAGPRSASGDTARGASRSGAASERSPANGAGTSAGARSAKGAVLWYVDGTGTLRTTRVRTGLTDGTVTQIDGSEVAEGMEIIAAVTSSGSSTTQAVSSPFASTQQQGGPRPPGGI